MSWFNPGVSLLSSQLNPFIVEAGLNNGGINFGLTRDATDELPLGYSHNISLIGQDSMALSTTLNY